MEAGEVCLHTSLHEEKIMDKKDKYNSSGCLDMTAFLAMRNIEREESERSKAKSSDKQKKRHKSKQRRKQCHR